MLLFDYVCVLTVVVVCSLLREQTRSSAKGENFFADRGRQTERTKQPAATATHAVNSHSSPVQFYRLTAVLLWHRWVVQSPLLVIDLSSPCHHLQLLL